jgi:hypothetical protein
MSKNTSFRKSGFEVREWIAVWTRLRTKDILKSHTCKWRKRIVVCGDSATQYGESEKCLISISLRSGNKTLHYSDSMERYGYGLDHRSSIPGRDSIFRVENCLYLEGAYSYEILATVYQISWRHISDDSNHLIYFAIFSIVIKNAFESFNINLQSDMFDWYQDSSIWNPFGWKY